MKLEKSSPPSSDDVGAHACSKMLEDSQCRGAASSHPTVEPTVDSTKHDSIGTARVKRDGTIVLELSEQIDGIRFESTLEYEKNNPRYDKILKHLGGPFKPGEFRSVQPWVNGKD